MSPLKTHVFLNYTEKLEKVFKKSEDVTAFVTAKMYNEYK